MMVVAHVAVGAAVGSLTKDPALALVVGIASHFAMDAVPHFDPGSYMKPGDETYTSLTYIWAVLDVLACLGLIAVLSLRNAHPLIVAAGGIGGLLPDVVLNTPFWKEYTRNLPGLKWLHANVHRGWHRTVLPVDWFAGVLTQVIAMGASLWLLGL